MEYWLEDIKNHKEKLIELLEVGDYVNGILIDTIEKFRDGSISFNSEPTNFCGIRSVVTKEAFKNIEYKVGE